MDIRFRGKFTYGFAQPDVAGLNDRLYRPLYERGITFNMREKGVKDVPAAIRMIQVANRHDEFVAEQFERNDVPYLYERNSRDEENRFFPDPNPSNPGG